MKKLVWIGDLYLTVYEYFDENVSDFSEKDLYLFILCLIKHKKIEHMSPIDHQFLLWYIPDVFKTDDNKKYDLRPYTHIPKLKQELDNFYNCYDQGEYLSRTQDYTKVDNYIVKLSKLPSWSFLDKDSINNAIETLKNNALYIWFAMQDDDDEEQEIFEEIYKIYEEKKEMLKSIKNI